VSISMPRVDLQMEKMNTAIRIAYLNQFHNKSSSKEGKKLQMTSIHEASMTSIHGTLMIKCSHLTKDSDQLI
jgi:hypothetical protein